MRLHGCRDRLFGPLHVTRTTTIQTPPVRKRSEFIVVKRIFSGILKLKKKKNRLFYAQELFRITRESIEQQLNVNKTKKKKFVCYKDGILIIMNKKRANNVHRRLRVKLNFL